MNKSIQRIMVIGRSGAGKSTFALKLQQMLQLPLYHLDKYFFVDHWEQRNYLEFLTIQQEWVDSPTWIIDGNSTKSYENRYAKAQLCVYFNFPRSICYWRVFKRLIFKDPAIDDRAPNCHETVRWSLLKYMWGFEKRVHLPLLALQEKYPNVIFIELKSPADVKALEKHLQNSPYIE